MRFASEDASAPPEPSIDDVEVPSETRLHDAVSVRPRVVNGAVGAGDVAITVSIDGDPLGRRSVRLEPEAETTPEIEVTPTEPGERELEVSVRADESEDPADRWVDTLVVTGRRLVFDWESAFVPADHAATATDTRHLAFACFLVQLRRNGDVIAEHEVGSDSTFEFVSGAFAVDDDLVGDERLESFDGATGRWLGTEAERTELVVPDAELLERADALQLYGYSLFETETSVRIRDGETTIDAAAVPTRDEGEAALEFDLREYGSD